MEITTHRLIAPLIVVLVLLAAAISGILADPILLALIIMAIAAVVVLQKPVLGLAAVIVTAVAVPLVIGTGTEVNLNPATLLIPVLFGFWLLLTINRRQIDFVADGTSLPLSLFLVSGIVSLLIGSVIWDPTIPRSTNLILIQLAQWAIFVFAAIVYWLASVFIKDESWLRRLTFLFLGVGGFAALLYALPPTNNFARIVFTEAITRAPFWLLLFGLAGGQILFNRDLKHAWRIFFICVIVLSFFVSFSVLRGSASTWVAVMAASAVLAWLRFPRLRWVALILLILLAASGLLFDVAFEFAGGQSEWDVSGTSRLVLLERVVSVSLRNPITGLGPAAYRSYTGTQPLAFRNIVWYEPSINSHNNYVDIFSQMGILGLGLFIWFIVALAHMAINLRSHYRDDFAAGYVNGMLAVGAASLVVMMLADWILPFVYNIGFKGFQASILVWLFMGGLVALSRMMPESQNTGSTGSK